MKCWKAWHGALTLGRLGNVARSQGDYAAARDYQEQSLAAFRAHRIRRRERGTKAVPSGVDIDSATPIGLAELLREAIGRALYE